jgi:GNAT superfamily N-acetyltransferase
MSGDSFKIRKPIPPETMFGSYRFVEQISPKECNCICTLCNNQKIVLRQDLISGKATKCADCYNKERNEKKQNNIKKEKEHQVNCDYCGKLFSRTIRNEKRSHKLVEKNACTNEACRLEKRKETNLLLRGKPYASQCNEAKEKVKNAWTAKTDDQLKEINEKREDTMFENHGVKNASQAEIIKNKKIDTSLLNWGFDNPMKHEDNKKKVLEAWAEKPEGEIDSIIEKRISTCIEVHGKFPVNNYGTTESSIRETLNSFGFDFKSNYTLLYGKQIDMYDENKKIGIEYCGLHWHHEFSLEPRLRDYHHNKCKILESQGVQLLTIFEDEWKTRQKQCLGHIKATLGICDKKLHGRKCIIKEVEKEQAQQFFDDYHIQGKNSLTIITFGLFYDDELVGVMSMGRHHRQGSDIKQVFLDRLCFKDGISVNGGSSKLLNTCKGWAKTNGYKRIISFSDNRWSAGKVYKAMGFTMEYESGPDYSYVNVKRPNERISKQSQQKKHTGCPADKTEVEWAHENGLARIWDCGKKRWVYSIQ